MASSSPLLRLVLVILLMVTALAAGMFVSSSYSGWLFLGLAFTGGPIAAVLDGRARNRSRGDAEVTRPASSMAARGSGAVSSVSVCRPAAGAASAW
jgi:hypothetical protein